MSPPAWSNRSAKKSRMSKPGDPVIINPIISCGHCDMCQREMQNLCRNAGLFGREVDGSLAELVHVAGKYAHPLPARSRAG